MKPISQYQDFDLTQGEKVNYSYYIALESIFNCFTDRLEELFYDMFNKVFQFSYQIKTGIRFQNHLRKTEAPIPIFIFEMSPIKGNALLIPDHALTNLFLNQTNVFKQKSIEVNNYFTLNQDNSKILGKKVNHYLSEFGKCWEKINPIELKLKKLVSNPVKAKIMHAHETCIFITVNAKYKNFSCQCQFGFSAFQLDPIMKKHYQKAMLLGDSRSEPNHEKSKSLLIMLNTDATYNVKGILGNFTGSHQEIINSLETGSVIPLENALQNHVIVSINDYPALSAEAGMSEQKLSLKINGQFDDMKLKIKKQNIPFSKLNFPNLKV
jgi:flagellar motor switch protein FliM